MTLSLPVLKQDDVDTLVRLGKTMPNRIQMGAVHAPDWTGITSTLVDKPIKPTIWQRSRHMQDEWQECAHSCFSCTVVTGAREGNNLRFCYTHDGLSLQLTTSDTRINDGGRVVLTIGKIELYTPRGHKVWSFDEPPVCEVNNLGVPREIIAFLRSQCAK